MEPSIRTGKLRAGAVLFLAVAIASMATMVYRHALQASKERVLQNNRFQLRVVVDEFIFAKQKSPQSMGELVDAGYLRGALLNPLTGKELSLPEGVHNALDMY